MPLAIRRFAFYGLSVRDKLLMKAMVERAARRTEQLWVPDILECADCIFYQGELPASTPAGAERVYVGGTSSPQATRSMQYPPRVSEFVAVLTAVGARLCAAQPVGMASNQYWLPLIEKLQQRLAHGEALSMVDVDGLGWTLHPAERQYTACGPTELTPRDLLDSASNRWRLAEPQSANGHPRRALETLLWFLGITAGTEGVLSSVGVDRPLRMRVWPYLLARAPRQFSQLATLLREGPRSAIELQATSGVPMSDVAAFVNACTMCGFLVPVVETEVVKTDVQMAPPDTTTVRPTQRFTRFLGAIRNALGMPA